LRSASINKKLKLQLFAKNDARGGRCRRYELAAESPAKEYRSSTFLIWTCWTTCKQNIDSQHFSIASEKDLGNCPRSFMKRFPNLTRYLLFLRITLLPTSALFAQSPDVTATVQFTNGQTIQTNDFSDPIGVQPGETVTVTVQFAPNTVGEPTHVGALDGGRISNASSAVSDQGIVSFTFQAAASPGLSRVVVQHGLRMLRMQFWALSPNPQNNPPVIVSANFEG
jgi:hypothetical protein